MNLGKKRKMAGQPSKYSAVDKALYSLSNHGGKIEEMAEIVEAEVERLQVFAQRDSREIVAETNRVEKLEAEAGQLRKEADTIFVNAAHEAMARAEKAEARIKDLEAGIIASKPVGIRPKPRILPGGIVDLGRDTVINPEVPEEHT